MWYVYITRKVPDSVSPQRMYLSRRTTDSADIARDFRRIETILWERVTLETQDAARLCSMLQSLGFDAMPTEYASENSEFNE